MPLRVLHVLPSISTITGGPAKSIPLQLAGLAKLGHHVEILTTRWPQSDVTKEEVYEANGVIVRIFPTTRCWPLDHVPYSRDLIAAVRGARDRFDFYQASSLWNPLISHTLSLYRRYQLPYAITCHGMLDPLVIARHRPAKWLWQQLCERRNVEEAEIIHFTSEEERRKAETIGWRFRRTLVMPINVDTSDLLDLPPRLRLEEAYPQLAGREVVAFVGRINWVKNLDLLVAAIGLLCGRGRNVHLLCAGPDDGERAGLEQQAVQLGIGDRVTFCGLLEGEPLRSVYARADVAVLVSRKENFGLAAAEALSAGVPVVLSDGVDMGKHWTAPPVWRVEQQAESIAEGLAAALSFSHETGLPSAAARELAQQEWGRSPIGLLSDAFEESLAARRERSAHDL